MDDHITHLVDYDVLLTTAYSARPWAPQVPDRVRFARTRAATAARLRALADRVHSAPQPATRPAPRATAAIPCP